MSPGPRPTSIPSGILIQPAVWPQQTWAENWGLCPFEEASWVPSNSVAGDEAYLRANFYPDPSNRLVTIHQCHRQTDRTDRQRTDSIRRTVLQTVAQKIQSRSTSQFLRNKSGKMGHINTILTKQVSNQTAADQILLSCVV